MNPWLICAAFGVASIVIALVVDYVATRGGKTPDTEHWRQHGVYPVILIGLLAVIVGILGVAGSAIIGGLS